MKYFPATPLLLLLWLFTCTTKVYSQCDPSTYMKEFDDSEIQPTLERATYSLIYFYSDSCKYCQLFNPVFENLCTLYNSDSETTKFQILKTNARVNKKLGKLFTIQHYPTLKLLHYPSKQMLEYEGGRDLHSLIDYIDLKTTVKPNYDNFQSKVKYVNDLQDLLEGGDKDKVVIFLMSHLVDWKDCHFPAHYIQRIAHSHKDIDFYVYHGDDSNSSELLPQFGVSHFPSMVYIRNGKFKSLNTEQLAYQTNEKFDGDKIVAFIESIDADGFMWRSIEPVNQDQITNDNPLDDGYESDDDIEHIEL
ncbi:Thioredoxin family protein [Candida parapsilosis]|uniref:Thioredoxin domain-containing protein n=2 Tax=Candida parapsilosis TaxID=5480 RepID=G8BIQ9_CANPC|nr:uncharacterized protein CPAR2_403270 [Candida parapsilosis]KAF6047221.1 Thioredoxin family protein [Candida parapsilosis]KAF6047621.1 Thioredoxin family protein [Candida parapsilosis]KAF6050411.1 Thioredoxin family protein [Candida parapsilosis]KAF6061532.1 Thioredoxin family protein [Candida parapsilosis]CAD1811598.1 unnamed protein product [Candida parapsilosis]